jgi:ornithine carbamoyltransferase
MSAKLSMSSPRPRHFLTLGDFSPEALRALLDRADRFAALRGSPGHPRPLAGRSVAILFEKPSTRTRLSFEVAVHELGGYPLVLFGRDTQIGRGEPIADTARVFSGFVHALVWRTFAHERLEEFARHSEIPVINALSDDHHPCQILADLQTVRAAFGRLEGLRVAWVGDGNNVAHSWIEAAGLVGFELVLACPEGYEPRTDIVARARATGRGEVRLVRDPREACEGAQVVTTDVWASMGQEEEAAARRAAFSGYCVDAACMARADSGAIFLHCLPAHRGEEVAAEVIDGPASRVWQEAENRLHTQKALLELTLAPPSER